MLLPYAPVIAQHLFEAFPDNKEKSVRRFNALRSFLWEPDAGTALKPTGTAQRLVGKNWSYTSEPVNFVDTTGIRYSGTRGSKFNRNTLDFNTDMSSLPMPMPIAEGMGIYPQTADEVLADSIFTHNDNGQESYYRASYNPQNKKTALSFGYNTTGTMHVRYQYDSEGYITRIDYPQGADTTRRWIQYGPGHQKITGDTTRQQVNPIAPEYTIWKYSYNTANQLDSVALYMSDDLLSSQITERYSFTYDNNNRIRTLMYETWFDPFGHQVEYLDSFVYLPNGTISVWYNFRYDEMGNRGISTRWTRHMGSNGLPDTVYNHMIDPSGTFPGSLIGYDILSYNNYNNPVKIRRFENMNPEPFEVFSYYYELYDDGLSVGKVSQEDNTLSVYPNPFRNNVSIDWKGKQQSAVAIRLVNILGQEVYSKFVKLSSGKNTLDLPPLNSGNYILMIVDAEGKSWSSKVVKQ